VAEVARLRSDGAPVKVLGMAVRLAQDHVEQEPFEPAVGHDRDAQRGAALVQLGDEKIDEVHRAGAEFGGDREARVEEERLGWQRSAASAASIAVRSIFTDTP
jgi:hypothetical protein